MYNEKCSMLSFQHCFNLYNTKRCKEGSIGFPYLRLVLTPKNVEP